MQTTSHCLHLKMTCLITLLHGTGKKRVHQAYPYCTSVQCLRIEKHPPVPPGSVGHLNITNTVHQDNPYCTSLYFPRIEKHHSVPSGAVLVSNSTTQFHLVLSTYQAGFSLHKIMDYTSVMYYYNHIKYNRQRKNVKIE